MPVLIGTGTRSKDRNPLDEIRKFETWYETLAIPVPHARRTADADERAEIVPPGAASSHTVVCVLVCLASKAA